jgi:hypothetical protein
LKLRGESMQEVSSKQSEVRRKRGRRGGKEEQEARSR